MTQRRFTVQVAIGVVLSIVLVGLVIHQLQTAPAPRGQPPLEQLARYGAAPDFTLVERSGRPVSAQDLQGRVGDRRPSSTRSARTPVRFKAVPWPRCKRT